MCLTCRNEGRSGGWYELVEYPLFTVCPFAPRHGNMIGRYDKRDPRLVPHLQQRLQRRPTIETINLFFQRNTVPKGPVDDKQIDMVMLQANQKIWFDEFKQRLTSIKNDILPDDIQALWDLLVQCFVEKNQDKAYAFLGRATELGLKPLETPSQRVFWSGTESRKKAYEISQPPPQPTALEKTDVGTLLDKLQVFKSVPWDLSTLLWALVSRYFGMGATGDIHVYLDGGFAMGNVFWNDELPALRLMQRYGAVRSIILHIWHTRDQRWIPEFDIQSDQLLLVFNKSKRVPDPTPTDPNHTRSFRFAKPIKVAVLRRTFERFLQSGEREHPLVLYAFRQETGIFATPRRQSYGLEIQLFEYGAEVFKQLSVIARDSASAFNRLPAVEKFLMANYQLFNQLPAKLVFYEEAVLDCSSQTGQILAIRLVVQGTWRYKLGFIRNFACKTGVTPAEVLRYIFGCEAPGGAYLATKYRQGLQQPTIETLRPVLSELFDGPLPLQMDAQQRIACLRHIHASMGTGA